MSSRRERAKEQQRGADERPRRRGECCTLFCSGVKEVFVRTLSVRTPGVHQIREGFASTRVSGRNRLKHQERFRCCSMMVAEARTRLSNCTPSIPTLATQVQELCGAAGHSHHLIRP